MPIARRLHAGSAKQVCSSVAPGRVCQGLGGCLLTDGLGAHAVIEAIGTQEAMMQAIRSTRAGGHVGFVGVSHDVAFPGNELFMAGVHIHGGPAPVRAVLA